MKRKPVIDFQVEGEEASETWPVPRKRAHHNRSACFGRAIGQDQMNSHGSNYIYHAFTSLLFNQQHDKELVIY